MDEVSSKMAENRVTAKGKVSEFIENSLPYNHSDAMLSILNGMVGDYLVQRNSRLMQEMIFRDQQQTLSLEPELLSQQLPEASDRIVLCVHGWCMNDVQWQRKDHDHGRFLAKFGYTPVYLRYNTGQHISFNGEEFAFKLEKLIAAWPREVKEVVIVGHSMGGLVTRSACYYAEHHQLNWLAMLRTFISLGTPHNGAPLAQLACWVDERVAEAPYLSALSKISDVRSNGSRDLSQGYICHADWQEEDNEKRLNRVRPALPEEVACYAIATCLGRNLNDESNRALGDGLVPVSSALGESEAGYTNLLYSAEHQWIGCGINHLDLLNHPLVASKLKEWVLSNTVQSFDALES
ncbi:alpha/beta hydrolase [Photobacterium sagamiensis]|uniref:PGAP1-like alpha/beta domain-containing protein n=1 Tax=Photobacterium sagamiensis TaxID=2910241 RepID=UPI003D0D165D